MFEMPCCLASVAGSEVFLTGPFGEPILASASAAINAPLLVFESYSVAADAGIEWEAGRILCLTDLTGIDSLEVSLDRAGLPHVPMDNTVERLGAMQCLAARTPGYPDALVAMSESEWVVIIIDRPYALAGYKPSKSGRYFRAFPIDEFEMAMRQLCMVRFSMRVIDEVVGATKANIRLVQMGGIEVHRGLRLDYRFCGSLF